MMEELGTIDLSAYHSAIVRIATLRTGDRPQLIFASVELVTSRRPIPDSTPINRKGIPQVWESSPRGISLAFRRVAMSAGDAVTWYRSLGRAATLPVPRADEERGKYDGCSITVCPLADEPAWPHLSTPLADASLFGSDDDFYPTPFIGAGGQPARVHRRLAEPDDALLALSRDAEACAWLRRRIHFDISRHDELIGGAVLVVPDPDVRRVSSFMTRNAQGKEYLVAEVLPYHTRRLDGLTMMVFEERFGAMNLFKTSEVRDELIIVEATDQLEHTGHALWHENRGLIAQQKALPYIRSINIDFGVINRRVNINTRDTRRNESNITSHTIDEVGHSSKSIVALEEEAPDRMAIAARFYGSSHRRERERAARKQDMQWFADRKSAAHFIRERIGRASQTIMVVDPYADGEDLFNFGHFVRRTDISLRLLTSRLAADDSATLRRNFAASAATFVTRGLAKPEVRIMKVSVVPAAPS
ncbi:VPA1262 family N-terminal domain-containing protein [Ancylobacter sp. VNQ12]|uniref:VPA1262 family N-terminal domain-containing protein n=1 Tax=Ancylobacter sp. VNQ12 TaxID=3400920 RepID=UPI003BFE561A